MQLANHHAHSHFSDGRASAEAFLREAIDQGLLLYGFSDHAPIPLADVGLMAQSELAGYVSEIERLRATYGDRIQVYRGLEIDYIPDVINVHSEHLRYAALDYTIGAVHYVDYLDNGRPWGFESSHEQFAAGVQQIFGGKVRAAVERYYALIREMVKNHPPDVVAHLDRIKKLNTGNRYFRETASWYQDAVIETLETIAASGVIMEVNTKGFYKGETPEPYPGRWILQIARELDIPVHLSSDAHDPEHITGGFTKMARLLHEVGYSTTTLFLDGEWQEVELPRAAAVR
jgi:histidinol-phosphatase (PHP family)